MPVWRECFKSQASVIANGGVVYGAPTINNGLTINTVNANRVIYPKAIDVANGANKVTLRARFKTPPAFATTTYVLAKVQNPGAWANQWILGTSAAGVLSVFVATSPTDVATYWASSAALATNTEYDIVASIDGTLAAGSRVLVYNQGSPVAGAIVGTIPTKTTSVEPGMSVGGRFDAYACDAGLIVREVSVFRRALSERDAIALWLENNAWDPRAFGSALVGWWRSDQFVTTVGTDVSSWGQIAGNGYAMAQGTPARRPTLVASGTPNGMPLLRFLQANTSFLVSAAFTLNQPVEVIMSCNWTGTANPAYLFSGVGAVVCAYENGLNTALFAGSDANVVAKTESQGAWKNLDFYFGSGTCAHYVNTVQKGVPANPGANNPGGFALGAGSTGSLPATVDVSEVVIVSRSISPAERAQLYAYMRNWSGY